MSNGKQNKSKKSTG